MLFDVQKLHPDRKYGVVINGLSEADLASDGICSELRNIWIEHGLVVFEGPASSSFHLALSRVFGQLETHPVREALSPDNDKLIDVRYDPAKAALWEVDGQALGGWLPWHSDMIYVDHINHGGILRPITLPSRGGDTGFIDRIESYEVLPSDIKERIKDLSIVYKWAVFSEQRYVSRKRIRLVRSSGYIESLKARQHTDFPHVVHPIVYRQPETDRYVLNVSPMSAAYILGMDNAEGHDLLRTLVDYASNEDLAYYHQWKPDQMVLWDNWRQLHSASGFSPLETRYMQRTTIAGDYKLGCKMADLSAPVSS